MSIQIKNLNKSFGEQSVLKNLNFNIQKGSLTVIIGRSGEGKSVFLRHLLGLILPDSGEVLVNGINLVSVSAERRLQICKQFGYLFQNAALFDSMTVYENIMFPLNEHSSLSDAQKNDRVFDLMNLVNLKYESQTKYPSELSGGMRKRVGLARAIALEPQILLYDEPTTGLDPIMTDVVNHLIVKTQKQLGITSVVISHDILATFAIADTMAMLYEGTMRLVGTPDDFKNSADPVVKNFLEGRSTEAQKELL